METFVVLSIGITTALGLFAIGCGLLIIRVQPPGPLKPQTSSDGMDSSQR